MLSVNDLTEDLSEDRVDSSVVAGDGADVDIGNNVITDVDSTVGNEVNIEQPDVDIL